MKTIGSFVFPSDPLEAKEWKPTFHRRMLHRHVMCLAKTRIEGRWNAYCFPVPCKNHDEEEYLWETEGVKIPEQVASVLFPMFSGVPYAK
jgi:hypothetical protein